MSAWPEPASFRDAGMKASKYCKSCRRQTLHEVRGGRGVTAFLCMECLRRAIAQPSDRNWLCRILDASHLLNCSCNISTRSKSRVNPAESAPHERTKPAVRPCWRPL